jgi:hypothetical protein
MLSCSIVSCDTLKSLKSYRNPEICIFACPVEKPAISNRFPGCFRRWAGAEIKPVEPDQGNACAGKVSASASPFLFL